MIGNKHDNVNFRGCCRSQVRLDPSLVGVVSLAKVRTGQSIAIARDSILLLASLISRFGLIAAAVSKS